MKADGTAKEAGAVAAAPTESKGESKKKPPAFDTIGAMIERLKPQIERALPKHVTAERLARVMLTAIRNNPRLQQAEAVSLMASIMTAAQLGLEANTPLGQCWIIPYKNNKTGRYEAQFQMGYQGLVELCYRTDKYKVIDAYAVDEADNFEYEFGTNGYVKHRPADKPTGKIVYYYAYYKIVNGGENFKVWSRDKVYQHAVRYSKSWDKKENKFFFGSAWAENFDSMALVPVIKNVLKVAPKSIELSTAMRNDNQTLSFNPDDPDLTINTIDGDFELEGE